MARCTRSTTRREWSATTSWSGRPLPATPDIAEALHATKIIYLTPQAGLEIDGEVRREISVETLRSLIKDHPEQIGETSLSKAVHAVKAIETGTPRVHVVDGRVFDGLLNEIFSSEGVGSLIYGNDYQSHISVTTQTR